MSNYSTHVFANGAILTVKKANDEFKIVMQDSNENIVCDVAIGEFEALCLAQSILKVATTDKE
jgi:hypothetical protein